MHEFSYNSHERNIKLSLFRKGILTVKIDYPSPLVCNEHFAKLVSLGLQGRWNVEGDDFILTKFSGERRLIISKTSGDYIIEEQNYPANKKHKFDSFDSLKLIKVR
jgi:hypothetical protein